MNRHPHCLFQYSGVEAFDLLEYDGSLSIQEIRDYGNFGLGCFNALDGELIAFEDNFFHATADGALKKAMPAALVSCVYMTHFIPHIQLSHNYQFELAHLANIVKQQFTHQGQPFYAIRIVSHFDKISVRSVPPQKKPYPTIEEVVKEQALFEFNDVKATMIGFHFPNYLKGLTFAGFHLHFVTDDLAHGGHVLDFSAKHAEISLCPIESYHHLLPDYARQFNKQLIPVS